MTWLAPWALAGGALGMLGVVAAHLLSRQRPRALALATARFLPAGMLEATTVQRVPRDRWWMLLRLVILALLAMGVAQPVLTGRTVPTRTILLLDRTLPLDAQRSALATLAPDDAVIPFDTAAALKPLASVSPVRAPVASLSAALAVLVRVRDSLALGADDVRITAASRFAPSSLDPATQRVRALLRDSIAVVPLTLTPDSARTRGPVLLRADGDDPVAATALLLGDSVARTGTVIVRRADITADDAGAAERGATVVHWPTRTATGVPSLQGITVGNTTWIAPLHRDTTAAPAGTTVVGWWADGSAAVWRRTAGRGCIFTVHVALPAAGDHTLSLAAQAWLHALVTSCDSEPNTLHAPPDWLEPASPARSASLAPLTRASPLSPWLIVAALTLAAIELVVRAMRRV